MPNSLPINITARQNSFVRIFSRNDNNLRAWVNKLLEIKVTSLTTKNTIMLVYKHSVKHSKTWQQHC